MLSLLLHYYTLLHIRVYVTGHWRAQFFSVHSSPLSFLQNLEACPMQSDGDLKMLYEPGPWDPHVASSKKPVLHVGYLEHVLCRAPLIPCFLDGSSTNTTPHSKKNEASRFPHGKCDSHPGTGNGSLVYEVNTPHWRFGRGKSRSMSVKEAEGRRAERITAARQQAASTKRRRNN